MGDLFLMPLMWYWVGGGFSALFGTASCLASIFVIMDPEVIKKYPLVRTYTVVIHMASPLVYTLLARWTGWFGQAVWVAFTAWRFWKILRREPAKAEIPPGRQTRYLLSTCTLLQPVRTAHKRMPRKDGDAALMQRSLEYDVEMELRH